MDLNEEELEQCKIKLLKSKEQSRLTSEMHSKILDLINNNEIIDLIPLWHTNPEDINFFLQKDQLDEKLLAHGFTVIENVNIEILLDNMEDGNPDLFREKKLYNEDLIDTNISKVINHWMNNEKLIPPTITIADNFLTTILKCPPTNNPKLFASDGKHRLNVAYFFGSEHIPIVVLTPQLDIIKVKLGM